MAANKKTVLDDVWSSEEKTRIVETFKWDIPLYKDYFVKFEFRNACLGCVCGGFTCMPCIKGNVNDRANSLYVAVTKDEILFCQKQIKTCWRCYPCDQGETRKTIPLDRVQDVVLKAPAGDCCPAQMLHVVEVQTAGSSGGGLESAAELVLQGLENSQRFVDTVRKLKREKGHTEFDGASGGGARGTGTIAPEQMEMNTAVLSTLKGIESKTKESIVLLEKIAANTSKKSLS